MSLPSDLANHIYPTPHPCVLARLEEITVAPIESDVDVVYVQPEASNGERCIDFARFAEYVGRHCDPFSVRFAEHLQRWRARVGSHEPTG